jgi:hypothetical protein
MINNYRLALRLLAFLAISFTTTIVLMGGSQEDIEWGKNGHLDTPSYAETLTEGLDCDTDGALPEVAIVSYKDKVAAVKVSDHRRLDIAFRHALADAGYGPKSDLDPNIREVNALCTRA